MEILKHDEGDRPFKLKSPAMQYSGYYSVYENSKWVPIQFDYLDYIDCDKVVTHPIIIEFDDVIGYHFPIGECHITEDEYPLFDQHRVEYEELPECMGDGFYRAYKGDKEIKTFKLHKICGTCIAKDKTKGNVTLLTPTGVVNVKIWKNQFAKYDKQISEKGADGKKHVIEKSWLSRGNKIIVTGIKQSDGFLAKKYNKTPYHLVELITEVTEDGWLYTKGERMEAAE